MPEVIGLMKNMGFRCCTKIIKQYLKYLEPTLRSTYFISGDEDTVLEDVRKLTLFRKYKKRGTIDADRLTYDLSIMDHTYAEVPDSVSESSDEGSSETDLEKLTNHNVNRIIGNNVNINKILKTPQTYGNHRKNKKVRNSEKRHFKISLIREQVTHLCIDDRGPKISSASAAKYLKSSEMLIDKWISQAIQIKKFLLQKNKYRHCSQSYLVIGRLFILNPNLTQLQIRFIMDHVKVHVSSTKLQQILLNLGHLLNTSEFSEENEFDKITLDDEDLDYCINTLTSLIGWNNTNSKKVLENLKEDGDHLAFQKIVALSSLEHILNYNYSENSPVLENQLENIQGIKDNLDSHTNEIYFSPSYVEIQGKSSSLCSNVNDINNTKDLIMSISSVLSDKTNVNVKTGTASITEVCKQIQVYSIQPFHVKLAVVKEQVIYLHLNPHGPKIDLSTIASHLNQPKAILETWINQASYIQHTVQRLHKQHTCGSIQEAVIRVFKMNPTLSEAEAAYVLNCIKIPISRYRLERYLEQTQYILDVFEWPAEILPEEKSLNEIPLDEKELNYCNNVIASLLNTNEFEKHNASHSISENLNCTPSDRLRLDNNEFSIDINDEPIACVPKEEIMTDSEYFDTINEEININEKIDVPDSTQNKQIQNEELVKVYTKISQVDIVNFRKVEKSSNQYSYNETIIPESIIQDEETVTCDNELDMIDGSSGKKVINSFTNNCQLSNNHEGKQNKILEDVCKIKTKIDSSKKTEKTKNNMYNLQAGIEIIEEKLKSSTHHDREDINCKIKSNSRQNIEKICSQNSLLVSADYKRKKRKLSDNEDVGATGIIMTEIIENEDEDCIIIKYY